VWDTLALVLKGTALLIAAWLLTLALRRASASVRHLVWALALVGLLLLPGLSLIAPAWPLPFDPPWPEKSEHAAPTDSIQPAGNWVAELPAEPDDAEGAAGRPEKLTEPAGNASLSLTQDAVVVKPAAPLLRIGWDWLLLLAAAAGAVLTGMPMVLGWWSLRRLRRKACLVGGRAADLLQQLAAELQVRRSIVLLGSDARSIPMTWGIRRPIILLPTGAEKWSEERLRMVLLHELAHIKRGDCGTQILAHLVRALYWFNPLVWLAVAALRTEQERACDDLVLSRGASAPDYAQQLLTITSGRALHWLDSPVALAIGRAKRIQRRLTAILDGERRRRPLTGRMLAWAFLTALGVLLPLATVRLRAAVAAHPAPDTTEDLKAAEPPSEEAKKILEVRSKILERALKPLDDKAISAGAIHGMIEALHDPYAEYFTPEMSAHLNASLKGSFSGIGAQLRYSEDKKIVVVTALEDSPALKAGLRPGDVILAIDGKTTQGETLAEGVKQILGPQGSVVKLKVQHAGGGEEELSIKRARIQVRSVVGFRCGAAGKWEYLLDGGRRIGYVQIMQFSTPTVKELREAIVSMQKDGLKALILDLRFCPGGLMASAIDTVKLFLAKGTIVSVKGQDHEQTWKADGKRTLGDFPLVVLVNPSTASAAEIVAGALKENDRAIVVGTRTYGKGSVQEIIKLGEGGALKLTTANYHLPGGRNIHKRPGEKTWGVDPTDGYYVPMTHEQNEALYKSMMQHEVLRAPKKDAPRDEKITPQTLAEKYADPQLAVALKTTIARIEDGAFVKVGKSTKELIEHLARHEELEKKRAALKKQLEEINKELDGTDPGSGGSIRPPK
jgi:carboxyl-terminal processing protease